MLNVPANHSRLIQRQEIRIRGQILPFFGLLLTLTLLLVALIIDGTMALQTHRDLATIAYHAARAGIAEVGGCRSRPGEACVIINQTKAMQAARAYADNWLAQSDANFGLPYKPPSGVPMVQVQVNGNLITVTITRCYQFYFALPGLSTPNCPVTGLGQSYFEIRATASAQALAGN